MDAAWHLIQYTADMRRREPRNIGVAVEIDGVWAIQLVGTDDEGVVDGRSLRRFGLTKDAYEGWAEYYRNMILSGNYPQVLRSQLKRPTEFRLLAGGYLETSRSAQDTAANLFADLVHRDEVASEPHAKALRRKVERTLEVAQIQAQPDVTVEAKWGPSGSASDDVEFDYSYMNGQRHLMHRLQLHHPSADQAKVVSRDFNARVEGARSAGAARSFVAFYSAEALDAMGDGVLSPAWRVATTIDVDQPEEAADQLLQIVS